MSELTPHLIHLASLIDSKEAKIEKTRPPFLRRQLQAELELLIQRYESEFGHVAAAQECPSLVQG